MKYRRSPDLWSGISPKGHEESLALAAAPEGERLREALSEQFTVNYSRPMPYGIPMVTKASTMRQLGELVASLHTAVETIVHHYPHSPELQRVIAVPHELRPDSLTAEAARSQRTAIDLCRFDFFLGPDGRPMVLEVNANCPGGVVNAGESSRQWRNALERRTGTSFTGQPFEEPDWLARGLVDAYRADGVNTDRAVVAYDRTGWRHEVTEIAHSFRRLGIPTLEIDPDDVEEDPRLLADRHIGYQKISVRRLRDYSRKATGYFERLRSGALNVQNGHASRFVSDNKLCLAVLSDPAFDGLFDAGTRSRIARHVPWSRNAALCSGDELNHVAGNPQRYVLKHPLSTRGEGVVVGVEEMPTWKDALAYAVAESWLVQERVTTHSIERWPGMAATSHDLSTFVVSGGLVGAFGRGVAHQKANVGAGGYTHPVVVAPNEWE